MLESGLWPLALYTDRNTIFQTPRHAELVKTLGVLTLANLAAARKETSVRWIGVPARTVGRSDPAIDSPRRANGPWRCEDR